MTPILFHGPEARDKAVLKSETLGRPVSEPLGDKGLKVADSRAIVELARNPGVGSKPPTLVLGPLDRATPEAADALLKTLEDLTEAPLRIILWADYLTGVVPTIRSRTTVTWCPPGPYYIDPLSHLELEAQAVAKAVAQGDSYRILTGFREAGKDWVGLATALCAVLAQMIHEGGDPTKNVLEAWLRLRPLLDGKGSYLVAIDALLPPTLGE